MKSPVKPLVFRSRPLLLLVLLTLGGCQSGGSAVKATWTRSELYFGMNRVDGTLVTDQQWIAFVDKEITPRFPAGLTVHATAGQYRDSKGVIQRERSRVMVVLYPTESSFAADADLRKIVASYVTQFNQESVLRTDSPANVWFLDAK